MKTITNLSTFLLAMAVAGLLSCSHPHDCTVSDDFPQLFPDYSDATVPCNIAPLNFRIDGEAGRYAVRIVGSRDSLEVNSRGNVCFPLKSWKQLLSKHKGESLRIRIFAGTKAGWVQYRREPALHVAAEPIDSWLVYRLIEPGYSFWGEMGIYQRCLESFEEKPIMVNRLSDENCMNCHSFNNHNPKQMMFHVRALHAGTVLVFDSVISKINTKMPSNVSAAVLPRWHPCGKYIAFSTNKTSQEFRTSNPNIAEVFDYSSDLVIYNISGKTMIIPPIVHSPTAYENFPEWSPDGKTLYFCSAPALPMPAKFDSLKFDLLSVAFDPQTGQLDDKIDTVFRASSLGKSATYPRISPDGRYAVIGLTDYGTFSPIYHTDNDLYLIDLRTKKLTALSVLNSSESDSYHSWSSNGRWLVFSSRRIDGQYTRPYIAYFDADGNFHRPFLLPQKNPQYYDLLLKSFNIPELISGPVKIDIRSLEKIIKGKAYPLKPY